MPFPFSLFKKKISKAHFCKT